MGKKFLISVLVLIYSVLSSQISVKTNLPEEIKIGSEITFEAKIWKGPIKNFSKYQMTLPAGVTVTEVDVKTGSFTQEDNTVKIIWAITPSENEYTITLKLNAGTIKGKQSIIHKYYYLEKGEKREIEMPAISINFVESLGKGTSETSAAESTENSGASDELKIQVTQLRKDSKEALEVGEKEKQSATKRLEEANLAVKKAKLITNEKEKSAALQKAMASKDKAESDLAVATRILTLAKSLQDNADEIEKLNQSLDSVNVNDQKSPSELSKLNSNSESGISQTNDNVKPNVNPAAVEKAKQEALIKGEKDAKGLYKPISVSGGNIKEIIQQVEQIKVDSKDAHDVGTREKKKAEQKLSDAYEAIKRAEYITDPEEKKLALEKADRDKAKAEKDLVVASKILSLAKSLEDNALEIVKLNEVDSYQPPVVIAPANTPTTTSASADAEKLDDLFKEEPTETKTKKENPKPKKEEPKIKKEEPAKKVKTEEENTEPVSNGLVYKLQIGAFTGNPDKSQFAAIGKVTVVKEGSMYKAFYGNFSTREEAVAKRDQLRAKGFDGFVVIFKDGVKLK